MERCLTFIRIPKNASTSIYNHIKPLNTIRDEVLPLRKEHHNIFAPSHCRLSEAVEVLGKEILDKVVFAVCRNPLDRMVSRYHFTQKSDWIPIKFKDFAEFVDFCVEEDTIASYSQSYHLDVDTKINIVRFENLQYDFARLLASNGILVNPILPKLNSTKHDNYKSYYTPTLEQKVRELWKEDFKRFNY